MADERDQLIWFSSSAGPPVANIILGYIGGTILHRGTIAVSALSLPVYLIQLFHQVAAPYVIAVVIFMIFKEMF